MITPVRLATLTRVLGNIKDVPKTLSQKRVDKVYREKLRLQQVNRLKN